MFKVFSLFVTKSLKLGLVSLQAILKPFSNVLMPPHSIGQRFYP